jgi:hypothetical protein
MHVWRSIIERSASISRQLSDSKGMAARARGVISPRGWQGRKL